MAQMGERRRDFERVVTFVDAIVAIAITLLVLPLAELTTSVGDRSVADLLREHAGEIGAFALSFIVIARLWLVQHHLLRDVVTPPRGLYALLMLWTATIVFLPFPTGLLPEAGSQALTKLLYIGTVGVNTAVVTVMALVVRREPSATGGRPLPDPAGAAINTALLVISLLLALVLPGASYYSLLLLTLDEQVRRLWQRFMRQVA
ncbi:MAG TPA: TMEM175 family protein [Kineosporiaceae bacterium]